ncbi:ribonuclease H [Sesbania bispinosa]|nr:ribonuclease H [Sesbania bispinosa]
MSSNPRTMGMKLYFGPWILVRKTPRRRIKANTQQEITNIASISKNSQRLDHVSASRFEVLQSTLETHSEPHPEQSIIPTNPRSNKLNPEGPSKSKAAATRMQKSQTIPRKRSNPNQKGGKLIPKGILLVIFSTLGRLPDDAQEEGQDILQTGKDNTQIEGAGAKRFAGLIRDLERMYHLKFIALLEPRISGSKVENAIKRMGFSGGVRMEAQGFSGGI